MTTDRHVPEQSGAVLDTRTGLREWFDSHGEAIRVAAARNAAVQTAAILAMASHAREIEGREAKVTRLPPRPETGNGG